MFFKQLDGAFSSNVDKKDNPNLIFNENNISNWRLVVK